MRPAELMRSMQLPPAGLRFVLAQGLPAVVDVRGASMTPTLAVGERLHVRPVPPRVGARDAIEAGDIVLLITADAAELLVHRVMYTFDEAGMQLVAHQGDMPGSSFAFCPRDAVIGKIVGFEADAARALPIVSSMTAAERATFRRRAAVIAWYCRARRTVRALHLAGLVRGARGTWRACSARWR